MSNNRRSIIWSMPKEDFANLVRECYTWTEILKSFGLKHWGNVVKTLRKRVEEDNVDVSHFKGQSWSKGTKRKFTITTPVEEYLTNESLLNNIQVKKYIIHHELIENKCNWCNLHEWNDQPLVLELDHIDGDNTNNLLGNLRLLCPNCHSQTNTWRGRKVIRTVDIERKQKTHYNKGKTCCDCETKINDRAIRCRPCNHKFISKTIRHNTPKTVERTCIDCQTPVSYKEIRCKPCSYEFKKRDIPKTNDKTPKKISSNTCMDCNVNISKNAKRCRSCAAKNSNKKGIKAERPPISQLVEEVKKLGYCGTGRKYGVSDNAIRKWIKG